MTRKVIEYDDTRIQKALERLKGITGFVTTLCLENDNRSVVFNRYNHVQRVLWTNQYLCKRIGVDSAQSDEIIILHDLNRWPFAQNSERGHFNQADNVPAYLHALNPSLSKEIITDVALLHKKQMHAMRQESRYAYVSDVIAGIIEDPLMLIAGLNVSPEIIPDSFVDILELDLSKEGVAALREICEALNQNQDVGKFNELFQGLFEVQCKRFIEKCIVAQDTLENLLDVICEGASIIKTEFLRPIVFPINNESVCHGNWIRKHVIEKLIDDMGFDVANHYLLSIDETKLLEDILAKGYILDKDMLNVYPYLDYTSNPGSKVKYFMKV